MLRSAGRLGEARDQADSAVTIREAQVEADPKKRGDRGALAESYLNRGLARRALGDIAGAAADVRRALELRGRPSGANWECFSTACYLAALSGLAGRAGSGVSAAEGVTAAEAAMALLRKAIEMGYRDVNSLHTEDALDPLRGREDFRLLMMDLEFPPEPFALDTGSHR